MELPTSTQDIADVKAALGENATHQQIFDYLAKVGRGNNTYVSPNSLYAPMYGDHKHVAIIRRNYKLGENPKTWIDDADFTIIDTPATQGNKSGTVGYPWAARGSAIDKATPTELRINPEDYKHIVWVPRSRRSDEGWFAGDWSGEPLPGSKNRYFNPDAEVRPNFGINSKPAERSMDAYPISIGYTNPYNKWKDWQWDKAFNESFANKDILNLRKLFKIHANTKGYWLDAFHGTPEQNHFFKFEVQRPNELFFHFTPKEDVANKFTNHGDGRILNVKLNVQRPINVEDSGWWNWYRLPEVNEEIKNSFGKLPSDIGQMFDDLPKTTLAEGNAKMMDFIKKDALLYKNYAEDNGGVSIAIPRSSQAKLTNILTYDDNGNLIPLSKRHDILNDDIRYKQGGKINDTRRIKIIKREQSDA